MTHALIELLDTGEIVRFHTNRDVRRKQPLSEHCWNMAVILDGFYEGDPLILAKLQYAVRYHDGGERMGDLPYGVKLRHPKHAANHKKLEVADLAQMGIVIKLTDAEARWVKIVDMLEAVRYIVSENGADELRRFDLKEQIEWIYELAGKTNQHDLAANIATFINALHVRYGKSNDRALPWDYYNEQSNDRRGQVSTDAGVYECSGLFDVVFTPAIANVKIQVNKGAMQAELGERWARMGYKTQAEYVIKNHYEKWADKIKQNQMTDAEQQEFLRGD